MKSVIFTILAFMLVNFQQKTQNTDMSIYDFQIQDNNGEIVDFSNFKGKSILIVNTASECGYTPQYADLQQLHAHHNDKVVVLGFPANNFGGQEPGSDEQIASFCEKNYGVTFTLFTKMDVVGDNKHPLYAYLEKKTGEKPSWNFCKYLVSADGKEISFYPASVNPGELIDKL